MKSRRRGRIVILSSPSGGGKTSLCRKLLSRSRRQQGWRFSVSYTTRQKRRGERNGREYYFVSEPEFLALQKKGAFAEACRVHLYRYGTPRKPLDEALRSGHVMLLDVDVQGALKLKRAYPEAITVFVLPPSIATLRRRLRRRGTETAEQLKVRFDTAVKEMRLYQRFEYCVVNNDLSTAVRQVLCIIESHQCRRENLSREHLKRIIG